MELEGNKTMSPLTVRTNPREHSSKGVVKSNKLDLIERNGGMIATVCFTRHEAQNVSAAVELRKGETEFCGR